jgi:hypothetical protein
MCDIKPDEKQIINYRSNTRELNQNQSTDLNSRFTNQTQFYSQTFENSDNGSNKQFKADRTMLLMPVRIKDIK